ncbi:MAG: flippase [Cetobacterium sp.]
MTSLAKNYSYNIIGLLTGMLFPFIIFPYISRILMPEYLGKISFTQSLTSYFIALALLGVPAYGIRELSRAKISEEKNEFSKRFTELFLISLVSSIISFILFVLIIVFDKTLEEIKILMWIYSLQVFFTFINLDYVFITLETHKRRTIRSIVLRVISLVLILKLVKSPNDYIKYGVILVFPELLARIIDSYFCRKYFYFKINELKLKKHLKPLATIFLYIFSTTIFMNLDATMLGFMKNEIEVGLYTTGSKLVKMVIPLVGILGTVMAPKIIGYIKNNDKKKLYEIINQFIDFNIILGIPGVVLMIFLSKDIILVISGENYLDSVKVMKIMAIIILTIPLTTFFGGQLLLPNDKEILVFKVAVIGMIFNIILNFLLIPKFGIEGATFATVFTEILIFFYRGYEVNKIYTDYKFITKERVNYLLMGFVSFLVIITLEKFKTQNYICNIFFFSIIYSIIYFGGLLILKDKNMSIIMTKILRKLR